MIIKERIFCSPVSTEISEVSSFKEMMELPWMKKYCDREDAIKLRLTPYEEYHKNQLLIIVYNDYTGYIVATVENSIYLGEMDFPIKKEPLIRRIFKFLKIKEIFESFELL